MQRELLCLYLSELDSNKTNSYNKLKEPMPAALVSNYLRVIILQEGYTMIIQYGGAGSISSEIRIPFEMTGLEEWLNKQKGC